LLYDFLGADERARVLAFIFLGTLVLVNAFGVQPGHWRRGRNSGVISVETRKWLKGISAERRDMQNYIWVAVGSALGGVARYWCSGVAARMIGETFPWGTLIVNIVGSFIIGFFATLTGPDGRWFVGSTGRLFVMVGICGGYTTFSSFSLQTLTLLHDGECLYADSTLLLRSCFA
jgi:fluoride exporter